MSFVLPMPVLETERLVLRGWCKDDFDAIAAIFGDDENARFIGGKKAGWEAWRHFAMIIGHFNLRGFTAFAVEHRQTNETIGYVGPWYPEGWPEPEIGYSLVPSAGGKGYATEAAVASLKYAYSKLGWATAISMMNKKNQGSKNVAQKMGAIFEKDSLLFGTSEAEIWRHLPPQEFQERFA